MVEAPCPCSRCFDLDDNDRLRSARTIRDHKSRNGMPTEAQLQQHAARIQRANQRREQTERRRANRAAPRQGSSRAQGHDGHEGAELDGGAGPGRWDNENREDPGMQLGGGFADFGPGYGGDDAGQGDGRDGNVDGHPNTGGLAGAGIPFPDTIWTPVHIPRSDGGEHEEWDDLDHLNLDDVDMITPPAYTAGKREEAHVRMAYLQAVLNNVAGNTPVRQTEANLRASLDMLKVAGVLPVFPVPARTLRTARRRIGVDPDQWIIQYAACPQCWKLFTPTAVRNLENPSCTTENCTGEIYTVGESGKRRPCKIIPQVSLIQSLRRMLLRKGFREKIRDSRNTPVGQNDDPNFVMKDMYDGAGGENSQKKRFENAINSIQWPSHISRLPKNLGENQSLKKADEWRRLLTVAPVILWISWKDGNDEIPDTAPPVGPTEKISTNHSRKRRSLYSAILFLCAGVRVLSNKTVSMAQAAIGQQYLKRYCLQMLELGVVLTINHHLAMHFCTMIKLFGPVYAWWLFAFERFNGLLKRVNHNGHDGGRIELTLMRNWVQAHLLYELLLQLPEDTPDEECALIHQIVKNDAERGGMAVEIAIFCAEASIDSISLPAQINTKPLDLYTPAFDFPGPGAARTPLYDLLLTHVRNLWPQHRFCHQFSAQDGIPLIRDQIARRLPYIKKDGLRYGSKANSRTKSDSFAFVQKDGVRVPVSIEDIFIIKIQPTGGIELPAHVCMVVRTLQSNQTIENTVFPWNSYSSLLGISVSLAEHYGPHEVMSASQIECPLALIPAKLSSRNVNLWIAVSFDHFVQFAVEPENPFEGGEGGEIEEGN
ncbi:hypothetical protein H1R20_g10867, partial [Candolleomyces eurysporus]